MQSYRLYFLRDARHIVSVQVHECETDAEALDWAETQADGRPMELWCLGRLVKAFSARS